MLFKNGELNVNELQKNYYMNKNVSVWRGVLSPPTHAHIWIKNDRLAYWYQDRQWIPLIDEVTAEKSGLMSKTDKQILDLLNENLHWN